MRSIVVALVLSGMPFVADAAAAQYALVTIGSKPVDGCAVNEYEKHMFASEAEARSAARRFVAESELEDKRVQVFKPGEAGIVYRYKSKDTPSGCVLDWRYATMSGAYIDDVRKQVRAWGERHAAELRGAPDEVETWGAAPSVLEREYEGVKVVYETRKLAEDRWHVFIRATNPHRDQDAYLYLVEDGELKKQAHVLAPNTTLSVPLGWNVTRVSAIVRLAPATSKPKPLDQRIYEALLQRIREEVVRKDGQLQAHATHGVRG